MANVTPYAGFSTVRLTALINQDNDTNHQAGIDFTFGFPGDYTDTAGRNTKVVITPVNPAQYNGPQELHYTRLPLTVLDELPEGFVQTVQIPSLPFRLSELLDTINTALGLDLKVEEIVDQQYSQAQTRYALPINQGFSLAWIDSDYAFPARVGNTDIPLSSVIQVQVLNGLTYRAPA